MKNKIKIYEDEYGEESADCGELNIAIPFRVCMKVGEDPEICVFPSLLKTAKEFGEKFEPDEMFGRAAMEWIRKKVTHFMLERMYAPVDDGQDCFLNYKLEKTNSEFILPSTRILTELNGLENLTEVDLEAMNEFGHICFGTVIDGKIVSCACTNYPFDSEDDCGMEIGVETNENFRNNGFALSNCAALAQFIIEQGSYVLYECESSNLPSIKLIERLCGEKIAKNFCIVASRIERTV